MENTEQTLIQLENDLSQVVIRRAAALLERLLDESYVFTNAGGEVKNKAQTLAKFRALVADVHFDFITNSDLRVQVYGVPLSSRAHKHSRAATTVRRFPARIASLRCM